ncbi:ABC-type amino acid transport substrate-binding protein [Duganella sp. 1224]|uniref:substrate-binding periplasmic protein n=1 Tax=Duganella sp. 1224 TaxID=2587052 RepID=UPI0015CEA1CA|nr:transporter substrate-binding domain-containing protein [Duganella sp. 1224]NYE62469.1 ABC-type amino acid transport substrate-binding protein [Duganella sp. 1224]
MSKLLWRRLRIAASPLLFAFGAATASGDSAANEVVHVLVEDNFSPWSNHNGTGLANELVRAAFGAVHVDVDLRVVPYARCRALVIRGASPSCFSMSPSKDLADTVRFADKPLYAVTLHAFVGKTSGLTLNSIDDLRAGMRVGVVNGYEYPPGVAELAKRGVVLESTQSETLNLRKLAVGRLDVALVLTDQFRSAELVKLQSGAVKIMRSFAGASQPSFIGFSMSHPDAERQRTLFNAGFKIITENGKRAAIESQWHYQCSAYCPE